MLDTICGYFAVTGFYNHKTFIPREIALLSNTQMSVFQVDHGVNFDDLAQNSQINATTTSKFIGLPFTAPADALPICAVHHLLNRFHSTNKNHDQFLIACVTPEAEQLLREAAVPRVNLITQRVMINHVNPERKHCPFHSRDTGVNYSCCLNHVQDMEQAVHDEIMRPKTFDRFYYANLVPDGV